MSEFNWNDAAKTPGGAIAAALMREAETWASTQGQLFSGLGEIWTDWVKRQGEAVDAASRSLQQVCECRSPADLVQVQQQWMADTVRRAASDVNSLANNTLVLARRVGAAHRSNAGAPGQSSQSPLRTPTAQPSDSNPVQRAAE